MELWHLKFARLRQGRGWSLMQAATEFVAASDLHTSAQIETVRRQIMRWEKGNVATPTTDTKRTIAAMFDLPIADFFPSRLLSSLEMPRRLAPDEFTDLVAALRMPQVGHAHLEQAQAEVERLCTAYPSQDASTLTVEVNDWIRTLGELVNHGRVNLAGHHQVVHLTGWLALLRSCLMWDQGDESASQQARVAAEGFANDLDDPVMHAWTWEIQAWIALTQGDMPQVIAAADAGIKHAPHQPVAAQLYAQKAKAYSRMGDQHKTEVALEHVRLVLDQAEMPSNLRNHFAVDPTKASFYAMDAYRVLAVDTLADAMADTVILTSVRPDGSAISPMRLAEALLTKATVLARSGDVEGALLTASQALTPERRSTPSLLMVASEVAREISKTNPTEGAAFGQHLRALTA
jgi:transcriptional regulator with XRE-family HTH domain